MFGVGVVIGTGIFVLTGKAAGTRRARRSPSRSSSPGSRARSPRCATRSSPRTVPVAGLGVHVLLRQPRRAGRLDHRLGPHPRARARRAARSPSAGRLLRRRDDDTPASRFPRWAYGGRRTTSSPAVIVLILTAVICSASRSPRASTWSWSRSRSRSCCSSSSPACSTSRPRTTTPFVPPAGSAGGRRRPRARPRCCRILGFAPGDLRRRRHLHRRRAGVLRVHRLRHRRDRRRGDQEAAAGRADRHPRLARHLHRARTSRCRWSSRGWSSTPSIKIDAPLAEAFRSVGPARVRDPHLGRAHCSA